MKLRIVTLASLLGLASTLIQGAVTNLPKTAAGLVTNKHDLNGAGCKTCHAPHNGSQPTTGTGDTSGIYLLWATNIPTSVAYNSYTSANLINLNLTSAGTLNNGLATTSTAASPDVKMYSLLCLSCHDGVTTTFTTLPNTGGGMLPKNQIGNPTTSGGLTNDHPVNIEYNPAKDAGLVLITTGSNDVGGLPLYLNSGNTITMQCATCHDPHNDSNTMFLRQANTSAHCLTCHK